jgi:hypothetical protein
MESIEYQGHYDAALECIEELAQLLIDEPARAIALVSVTGGDEALQAMFDAAIDSGYRKPLVETMNAPFQDAEVRLQLEILFQGSFRVADCQ